MSLVDHTKTGQRGQFFTPPAVAEFMWRVVSECVDGKLIDSRVIDPSSGEGVFLDVGLQMDLIRAERAVGIELDAELSPGGMAGLSRNMVGDALLGQFAGIVDGEFDVVIGNPPFGQISDVLPSALARALEGTGGDRFGIWKPGGRSGEVEQLFLDRALQLVRPGGIVAFVMPEGFLANDRAQAARDWVLQRAAVLAIASLPDSAFRRPGLNATTDVIVLRRHVKKEDADQTRAPHGRQARNSGTSCRAHARPERPGPAALWGDRRGLRRLLVQSAERIAQRGQQGLTLLRHSGRKFVDTLTPDQVPAD